MIIWIGSKRLRLGSFPDYLAVQVQVQRYVGETWLPRNRQWRSRCRSSWT